MRALDAQLVNPEGPYFLAARSRAREQIFWEGLKSKPRRSITLWLEPIITIGMRARLHFEKGWPAESLGAQSKDWAFDFVCYGANERAVVGTAFGSVYLFDLQTGKTVRKFTGQTGNLWALAPSPDGTRFITGSTDQTVCLWSPEQSTPLLTLFVSGNDWIARSMIASASHFGARLNTWAMETDFATSLGVG